MCNKYRTLREYTHVASKEHWCDNCMSYISPGEMYEGSVQICGGKFIVYKRHIHPRCEFPDEPDDYKEMEMKQEYRMAA